MPDKSFMSPTYNPVAHAREQTAAVAAEVADRTSNQTSAETARLQRQEISNQPLTNFNGLSTSQDSTQASQSTFVHNTQNVVANGDGDSVVNLSTAFVPNILDNYDVVTYHWKFFMVDNDSASSGDIFNVAAQTIIAESGVSDLTIDKVNLRSISTPSVESGTGTSTQVKFEIVEPAGAGLIDKIFYQSLALGIGNWNVMPFYLQLQFRGRTPLTSEADDGPGTIGGLRWIYPIKITNIKANVTTVGTRYEFECIIYNEYAQSNTVFSLQHPVVLNELSTFQDAMMKLVQQLNDDQFYQCIDYVGIPDSYKIIVDPAIQQYSITPPTNNSNTARNNGYVTFEGKTATFVQGTGIDKIVDALLSNTNEYQTKLLGAQVPGADGQNMNAETSQMKDFWRVITETRPLKYDPRRNDYAREYRIYVISYKIGILDQDTFQDAAPPTTLDAEKKRLMTYIRNNILKKKYNYIFTGLNDQIWNFDIKINNAFAVAVNRMGGIYFNSAMADKGVVNQNNSILEADVTAKIQRAISFQNTADKASSTEAGVAMVQAVVAINTANTTLDEKARLLDLLNHSKPESRLQYVKDRQTTGGIADTFNLAKQNAKNRANPDLTFISDVDPSSTAAKQAYQNYAQNIKGKLRPVARVEQLQQRQVGLGVDSNSNSGLQKLSSMFAVALHSSYDTSFASTTITIKGDPFWLFPQPYTDSGSATRIYHSLESSADQAAAIAYIKNAQNTVNNAVNIYGSDNFIIIRFRTPRVFTFDANPDSNNPNVDVETFSGVFKVVSITSTFDTGKFQQELHCLLDYNINILNFMDQIEGNAKKQDVPATPEDLTQSQQIPSTAIIEPRIMGSADSISPIPLTVINSIGGQGSSNIPTSTPNILSGLPTRFT